MCTPFTSGLNYEFDPGIDPDGKMILSAIDSAFEGCFLDAAKESYNTEILPVLSEIENIQSAETIEAFEICLEWYNEWDDQNISCRSFLGGEKGSWQIWSVVDYGETEEFEEEDEEEDEEEE